MLRICCKISMAISTITWRRRRIEDAEWDDTQKRE
jgi:hypothetical protein